MSDAATSRARSWLGGALAEATLVVFAVLVALAVDEAWEDRENVRLAERTVEAIAGEIRRNRSELMPEKGAPPDTRLADLGSALAAYREGREPTELAVHWDYELLSCGPASRSHSD